MSNLTGTTLKEVFSFPHPVNEYAARMVAGMVVALSLAIILLDMPWLLFFLAYGFFARVLTGPTLSPMGLPGYPDLRSSVPPPEACARST